MSGRGTRSGCVAVLLLLAVTGVAGVGPASAQTPGAERSDRDRRENAKRIGLSLLLPGAAQLRMGEGRRAAAFLVTEAATWTAWIVFRTQGSQRRHSYVEMAELQAGVAHAGGRDDDYFRLLGNWSSSDAYDQLVRRDARDRYPDDLPGRAAYFEANRTPADRAWRWESQTEWDRYRTKVSDSQHAYRSARMMLGVAAANRLVAMVDASLLAGNSQRYNGLQLQMLPGGEPGSALLSLSLRLP